MSDAILYPDAEALVVTHLNAALTPPVSTRVPNPRPATFVRVVRVGGPRRSLLVDSPMLVIECWAANEMEAATLAGLARAYVFSMSQTTVNGAWVYAVRDIAGPQAFPDPVSGSPRYQFTVQIDTRGTSL